MASVNAMEAAEPRGFGAEDFISFDFGGDVDDTQLSGADAGPSSKPYDPAKAGQGDHAASTSMASVDSRGKKRKFRRDLPEEDGTSDGMTKKERERAAARGTPWTADVNWDTARNAAQQLNRELIAFESWLSPTKREHGCRQMVIELIRKAISAQWRDAKVYSFGSQDTELYLPQGDIDLVVVSDSMETQRREGVLRSMAACLRRNNLATDVQVIAKAKVPIIKFVCTYGRYRCDISVNQTNGLLAAEWVNKMQHDMPAIRPLILITKHLLQQRGMSEVYTGGLGSFSVILLVVNFLQIHPKVQRGEIDPCRNLGVLFLDFLELYGKNFGYDDTGITVRAGGGYFSKMRRGWVDGPKPYKLSIEDPQSADNDISKGSYNILSVRSALSGAFDLLTSAVCKRGQEISRGNRRRRVQGKGSHLRFDAGAQDSSGDDEDEEDEEENARRALLRDNEASLKAEKDPESLLGSIIGVSRELLKSRRDIANLYDSGVLQAKLGRSPPARSPSPGPSSGPPRSLASRLGVQGTLRQPSPPPVRPSPTPPPPATGGAQASGVRKVISIKERAKRVEPQHSTPQRGSHTSGSRAKPFVLMDSSSDDDEDDSRYAQQGSRAEQESRRRRGPQGKDPISAHHQRYSSDGSGSDEESSRKPSEEGEIADARTRRDQRAKSRDYWLSKSLSGHHDDGDGSDV
ncbi:unnamed protein product [Parajaminaea phylloscopi]